jgi:hypothetical protein
MDVWMPESQLWLRRWPTAKSPWRPAPGGNSHPSVAQSPAVFAMPRPMARGTGLAGAEASARDILALRGAPPAGRPRGIRSGGVPARRDRPAGPTAKAQTAVAVLYSRVGRARRGARGHAGVVATCCAWARAGTDDADTGRCSPAGARRQRGQGAAVRLRGGVDEKSVVDYNRGVLPGTRVGRASTDDDPSRQVPLAAIYPMTAAWSRTTPSSVTTTDAARRARPSAFLVSSPQRRPAGAAASRVPGADGTCQRDDGGDGVLADQPGTCAAAPVRRCGPALMSTVQRCRSVPGCSLLDVSGSMDDPVARGPYDQARRRRAGGARWSHAVRRRDQVGLWIFSSSSPAPRRTARSCPSGH